MVDDDWPPSTIKFTGFVAVAMRLTEFIVFVESRDFMGSTLSDLAMHEIINSINKTNLLSFELELVLDL